MRYKKILFDFDGTLADTMDDNFLAWQRAFERYEVRIERGDYFHLEGLKLLKVAEVIGKKYSLPSEHYPRIVELKNKFYLENNSFRFYEGVNEMIEKLYDGGTQLALVTASPRSKLEKTVPKEFLSKFKCVVSGDDCERGKPYPDPYLKAIRQLGEKPENCIGVENAPLGVESVKSAGVYCIAITTTLDESYFAHADKIVRNHSQLSLELFS